MPLNPDVIVDVLDLQRVFVQQGWSGKRLVHFFIVQIVTIDVLYDVVVENLHHVLLVPDSIFVQELLRQRPHTKRPFELLASR